MTSRTETLLADLSPDNRDDLAWELLRYRPGPIPVPGGEPTQPQLMILPFGSEPMAPRQCMILSTICQTTFRPGRIIIQERHAPRTVWQIHDCRIGVRPQFYVYTAALPGRYCAPTPTCDYHFDTAMAGMSVVLVVSHDHPTPIEFRGLLLGYGPPAVAQPQTTTRTGSLSELLHTLMPALLQRIVGDSPDVPADLEREFVSYVQALTPAQFEDVFSHLDVDQRAIFATYLASQRTAPQP
jgi:hypothetical protein